MLFSIVCADRPGQLELRMATRAVHLEYLKAQIGVIVEGGPLLDLAGNPCGSQLIIDVADRAAAEEFAVGDPYAKAGLFESAQIRAFRRVFRNGEMLG